MLLNFLYFFLVIQGIKCAFPKYIEKCPKPDPNANNCVLEKARKAFGVLFHGDKDLNLPSFTPFEVANTKLPLGNNSQIVVNGTWYSSNDIQILQARIDLQQKYWYVVFNSKMITLNLNFIISLKETKNNVVNAKGRILVNLINWYFEYTGYYSTVTMNNKKYMQITHSKTKFNYEKYRQKILELTTIDNKKLKDSDRNEIQKALNNLEPIFSQYNNILGKTSVTNTFNKILSLEPEEDVFIH